MPTVFEENASVILLILAVDCGILTLAAIVLVLRALRASRGRRVAGEEDLRRELEEIGQRLAALEKSMAEVAEALPRSMQGVGVVRYNAFPDAGGGMSFSLALLDGQANGFVMSVLNNRDGSRVYGKGIESGTSSHPLSEEEQQALALARGSGR